MSFLLNRSYSYLKNVLSIKVHHTQLKKMQSTSVQQSEANRIVWLDLEMTGLDINNDHIMEIACLVTDSDLNIVAIGPDIVIHQPDHILNTMREWCQTQHSASGLTKQCQESSISLSEAENQVLQFVSSYVPANSCPLGGNSVYMDRMFLNKYMPRLNNYLHYRIIDVSSIKELAKRWYPKYYSQIPHKKFQHRCLSDIQESLEELKYYKNNVFKK